MLQIFFPILHDKHWMLLVVDCRERTLFLLDSLYPDENTPCAQTLVSIVITQKQLPLIHYAIKRVRHLYIHLPKDIASNVPITI